MTSDCKLLWSAFASAQSKSLTDGQLDELVDRVLNTDFLCQLIEQEQRAFEQAQKADQEQRGRLPKLVSELQSIADKVRQEASEIERQTRETVDQLREEQRLIASSTELQEILRQVRQRRHEQWKASYLVIEQRLKSTEERIMEALKRSEVRNAVRWFKYKFCEYWRTETAAGSPNANLIKHSTNLQRYQRTIHDRLLDSLRSAVEKRMLEALKALQWPKPLIKQYSRNELQRLAAIYQLSIQQSLFQQQQQVPSPALLLGAVEENNVAAAATAITTTTSGKLMASTTISTSATAAVVVQSSAESRLLRFADEFLAAVQLPVDDRQFPFQILAKDLLLRFNFHFETNRQTNRLDKPEWYFSHVLGLVRDHAVLLDNFIQPLIDQGDEGSEAVCLVARDEFIMALLPCIKRKIGRDARVLFSILDDAVPVMDSPRTETPPLIQSLDDENSVAESASRPTTPSLVKSSRILSRHATDPSESSTRQMVYASKLLLHLIKESFSFDRTLRDAYGFNFARYIFSHPTETMAVVSSTEDLLCSTDKGTNGDKEENQDPPCLRLFTMQSDWFCRWIEAESVVMFEKYKIIMQPQSAWELQYELLGADEDELKVTKSAVGLMDIVEAQTEHYKMVKNQSLKLRFLQELQLPLLETYRMDVQIVADQYENILTSRSGLIGVWRSPIASIQNEDLLLKICRLLASVEYVINVLKQWGDSFFFLELLEYKIGKTNDGDEIMAQSLFSEAIQDYQNLHTDLQQMLIKLFTTECANAFRAYERKRDWFRHYDGDAEIVNEEITELSSEILHGLSTFNQNLTALYQNLPRPSANTFLFTSSFHLILEAVLLRLDKNLFERMVMLSRFNHRGVSQLKFDIEHGLGDLICRRWSSSPSTLGSPNALVKSMLPRLHDCCQILAMDQESGGALLELVKESDRGAQQKPQSNHLFIRNISSLISTPVSPLPTNQLQSLALGTLLTVEEICELLNSVTRE